AAGQPQVGLVHQGGRPERLVRDLARRLRAGELAQLVVDERPEPLGGVGVTLLDGAEDAGDVVHQRGPERSGPRRTVRAKVRRQGRDRPSPPRVGPGGRAGRSPPAEALGDYTGRAAAVVRLPRDEAPRTRAEGPWRGRRPAGNLSRPA